MCIPRAPTQHHDPFLLGRGAAAARLLTPRPGRPGSAVDDVADEQQSHEQGEQEGGGGDGDDEEQQTTSSDTT